MSVSRPPVSSADMRATPCLAELTERRAAKVALPRTVHTAPRAASTPGRCVRISSNALGLGSMSSPRQLRQLSVNTVLLARSPSCPPSSTKKPSCGFPSAVASASTKTSCRSWLREHGRSPGCISIVGQSWHLSRMAIDASAVCEDRHASSGRVCDSDAEVQEKAAHTVAFVRK